MKISRNQWILFGVIVALLLLYYFLVVRNRSANKKSALASGEENNYSIQCGLNELGTCVGCTPATCPPGSDTAGEQSQGCLCDGTGGCLPACGAAGGFMIQTSNGWVYLRRKKKAKTNTATSTR